MIWLDFDVWTHAGGRGYRKERLFIKTKKHWYWTPFILIRKVKRNEKKTV